MELDTLKTPEERRHALSVWHRHDKPAVMIMGYAMYRILTETEEDWSKTKRKHPKKISDRVRNVQPDCRKYLQDPGENVDAFDILNGSSLRTRFDHLR